MYEKFMRQWNNKYRLLTALVLVIGGVIFQILSQKPLDMFAFYLWAAAVYCVMNVLMQKMTKTSVDFVLYVVLNMVILIVGFALTSAGVLTGVVLYTAWIICVVIEWIVNAILIPCDDILKRIVMGFVSVILSLIFVAIVYIVPVLVAALG